MMNIKSISFIALLCLNATVLPKFDLAQRAESYWQSRQEERAKLYRGEKPRFITSGYYEHGSYLNFAVDTKAFCASMFAGSIARGLYSFSIIGTRFESFKKTILQPGMAKSALFWLPAIVAYNTVVNAKRTQFIEDQLKKAQQDNMLERLQHSAGRNDH